MLKLVTLISEEEHWIFVETHLGIRQALWEEAGQSFPIKKDSKQPANRKSACLMLLLLFLKEFGKAFLTEVGGNKKSAFSLRTLDKKVRLHFFFHFFLFFW